MTDGVLAAPPSGRLHVGATRSGLPMRSRYGVALILAVAAMGIASGAVTHGLSPVVVCLLLAILAGVSATATT